jgi:hypothetical protein
LRGSGRMNYIDLDAETINIRGGVNPTTEDIIKDHLLKTNPQLAYNLHELRKEMLKRLNELMSTDSAYYMG